MTRKTPKGIQQKSKNSYRINYTVDGKRFYDTIRGTLKDAERALREAKNMIDDGTFVARNNTTFGDFAQTWLDVAVRPNLKPSTYSFYETLLRTHVIPTLGGIKLQRLSSLDISKLMAKLKEGGRADGQPGHLSPTTIRAVYYAVRKALDQAIKWKYLRKNPMADVDRPKKSQREFRPWSQEEFERFLVAAEDDPYYLVYLTAMLVGLRRGEVLGLRWEDLTLRTDGSPSYLTVRQTITASSKGPHLGTPKTEKSSRPTPIGPWLANALLERRSIVEREREMMGEAYDNLDLVFCQGNGQPFDPNNVSRRFRKAVSRAGVRAIPFHGNRHNHATYRLLTGSSIQNVADTLGHANAAFTLRTYTHALPEQQVVEVTRLEEAILGSERMCKTRARPTSSPAV